MKPKEVHIIGPTHDQEAFVIAVPDIKGGFFVSRFARYRDVGQLAVISGIEIVAVEQVADGDTELFESYYEMDMMVPGRMNMLRSTRASVVNGALANQTITEKAIKLEAQYGSSWIDEFEPRVPEKYRLI